MREGVKAGRDTLGDPDRVVWHSLCSLDSREECPHWPDLCGHRYQLGPRGSGQHPLEPSPAYLSLTQEGRPHHLTRLRLGLEDAHSWTRLTKAVRWAHQKQSLARAKGME